MTPRYCIGCKHWSFTTGREAESSFSTLTGGTPGTPAHMSCERGHWKELDLDVVMQSDIERAMQKAQQCPDFIERPAP